MSDSQPASANRAVFLSYASQDAEAAQRICEALRAAGVEVWFDQSELVGGDAWDAKIRGQINSCALFVPVISAATQARREGYFRLEWKLAAQRTHMMSERAAFLLPVVLDATRDADADVPGEFRAVQWTRLPHRETPATFVARVRQLLCSDVSLATAPHVSGGAEPVRGPVRSGVRTWIWVTAILVLALSRLGSWFPRSATPAVAESRPATPSPAPQPVAPLASDKSIAVLPFENMSDEKDNAFFADGVHEDILTNLANVGGLKVISRTSVIQYRSSTKPLRQIGTELGVAYVLEGSVRRAGNKVRVTGQLINARTDEHVWAASFDRDLTDIFAIQGELAQAIATALQAVLTPREKSGLSAKPTSDVAAYDLYLQARDLQQRGLNLRDQLAQVRPLLEHAVQIDSKFTLAWGVLARLHLNAYGAYDHSESRLAQAKAALETASRLQPDDPAVMIAQAVYHVYQKEFERAADIYRQVSQAYPNNTDALIGLSNVNCRLSRWAEALALLRRAQTLDPRGVETLGGLSELLLRLRRYDEAELFAREAAALQPQNLFHAYRIATIPLRARGSTEAIDALASTITPADARSNRNAIRILAYRAFASGDTEALLRLWEESGTNWIFVASEPSFDLVPVAIALLIRGEPARAHALLEKARDQLTAELAAEPTNAQKWADLGQVQAMLGQKSAALAAAEKSLALAAATHDSMEIATQAGFAAEVEAWAGETERAIGEITRLLRDPGASLDMNVHVMKHMMLWWPLQNDPRFEALLDDPKNNAPLL